MAKRPGLYANIAAKKKRIAAGSNERMRKVGSKDAPAKGIFKKIEGKNLSLMKGDYKPHTGAVKSASFKIQTKHKGAKK